MKLKNLTALSFCVVALNLTTLAHADRNELKANKIDTVKNNNNGNQFGLDKKKPVSVPEPSSLILLGIGVAGLGIAKRIRSKG